MSLKLHTYKYTVVNILHVQTIYSCKYIILSLENHNLISQQFTERAKNVYKEATDKYT